MNRKDHSSRREPVRICGLPWAQTVLIVAALAVSAATLSAFRITSDEAWLHLAIGRHIMHSGIPEADPFSHTLAGAPWRVQGWLGEVILAAVHAVFSDAGLVGLRIAAVLACCVGWIMLCVGRPGALWGVALLAPLVLSYSPRFVVQPELFAGILLIWQLVALDRALRTGRRWPLVMLPLLSMLWANVHPGALLGWICLVLFTAGLWLQARRHAEPEALDRVDLGALHPRDVARVWPWVGIALVAMLINPIGIHALASPLGLDTGSIVSPTDRLATLSTLDTSGFNRLVALALVVMVMWAAVLGTMHRGALTVMIFATAFALVRLRAVGDFGLLAVALIGPPFGEVLGGAVRRHGASAGRTAIAGEQRLSRWVTVVAVLALVSVTLICLPRGDHWRLGFGVNESRHPSEALAFLAANAPEGEGFNPIEWGGMVIWDLNERHRVYIDHRLDLYGEDFIQTDYLRVAQAFEQSPSWSTILNDRHVNWILLDRRDPDTASLAQALYRRQDAQPPDQRTWGLVHFDDLALVFFRRVAFDEETWGDLALGFRADDGWMREISPALLQIHPEWRERLVQMVEGGQGGRLAAWLLLSAEEKTGSLEYRRLALERLRQGRLSQAEHARIEYALGLLLMQESEYEEALIHVRTAQNLDPRSVEIAVALAGTLWNLRREADTVAAYEAVLELDPQHPEAREALIAHQEGRLWAEHPEGAPE